ncbi:MAG: carboxypeptidase-like regulatory domain-containing protein [Bacteroidia bacterium]|nr:carboxypeptidase-like regulatory domain-containing protein [Bacteroidia bacterium]NNF30752.1 TonB-dependent receptor plug domain-containing protein [Flavobacteriaceae bacterium]MBT8277203.1 carboxypeptidase-like regulatory domain-containing protein [Bacteroidia bacterium]NNJ81454.1 TonB-dependent receptor plug domain-containing protein [Flavobacteriaceae bacterium]NNK54780.1 TonB-dependent receptor plug domain-containing protein [Flavobacteriaceae bacterium]
MKNLVTLIFLGFVSLTSAQSSGSIVGKLTDKDFNNEPLAFANVVIKGTSTGTTSDFDGLYELANVSPGIYTIVYSFVGYETIEIDNVQVEANKVTTVNVPMGASAAALDEIVIRTSTRKESEVALLLEQKKATTIKQSIGSEELARKGVGDAAGAVTKISGISRQEGGSNVYVRGLGDRYLNTTYNGLAMPSNDIEKKNIDLNLFSSDIIQNVSVSKAYASDFYGDFAAGNVNILAKEYSGNGMINIDLGTGFNSRSVGEDFVKSEGTSKFGFYNRYDNNPFAIVLSHGLDPIDAGSPIRYTGAFAGGTTIILGKESKLSFFGTASFDNDFEIRRGPAVDFTTVEKKRFPNAEEFEYSTTTTAMANIIYRIDGDHKLSYNSLFINSSSDQVQYFGTEGQGRNRDAILDTDKGFYQMNVQFDQDMIFVNQLLGDHTFGENLELDWGAGYNVVDARQPDRRRISIERYDLAFDNDPNTQPSFFNNIVFDNQRYFQEIEDKEWNGRMNFGITLSEKVKLDIGYNGRSKERNFENIRYGYDFIEPNTPVTDVFNVDSIFDVENLGVVYNTFVFNPLDPTIGIGSTNLPGNPENTYTGILNIHAGYASSTFNFGEKWIVVPGLRLESFDQEVTYDVINLLSTDPGFRAADEVYVLPSLNVKYGLNDDQNLRFSFSKTVSFPEFKEVAPFVYEDVTQRIGGNPDLLNDPSFSEIFNLDLKYEWFLSENELLSLAAFAKQINDPVNKVIANDATGTQRFFRTGEKAEVFGVELEVRKNIINGEAENPMLSAGFNATYMHTEQDLRSSTGLFTTSFDRDTEELQGASPFLINADVNFSPEFKNYKPVANLVFSYFSDRIDAIGAGQLGNIIERGVPTLDFIMKNKIGDHFEINAAAKNILDPSIERSRETGGELGDIALSKYKRGINLSIQMKYNF